MTRKPPAGRGLDGHTLAEVMAAGARAVDRNRETINALNVFPVPDGDTGTNMALTMQAVVSDLKERPSDDASAVAKLMARSSLLAARGNSGLILAQFFKGLAGATDDGGSVDAAMFARALRLAAEAAYKAVPDPREGTMLTVFREAADAAEKAGKGTGKGKGTGTDVVAVWDAASRQATDAVRRTPEMLDVLREAGVVDAGGYGFAALLAGGLSYLKGESDGSVTLEVPEVGVEGADARMGARQAMPGAAPAIRIRDEFISKMEAEAWGYCVSFAIEGEGLDPDSIRTKAAALGKSCVVAGDDRQVKVHVHANDPGEPLTYAVSLGTLSNICVLNMDEQSREWARSQKSAASTGPASRSAKPAPPAKAERLQLAVVAVVVGDGFAKLFTANGLGACSVVEGGNSMNPSISDLLAGVEAAPAPSVILLPNNGNVVGTAKQVSELTKKAVRVVPTTSMQSGIAALLAFSPEQPLHINIEAMASAAGSVRSIAVCTATRDSRADGVTVKSGQAMGLVDGRLLKVGDDVNSLAAELVAESAGEAELATIYRGVGVSRPEAERVAGRVRERIPGLEVEVLDGDQPNYPYLIALE